MWSLIVDGGFLFDSRPAPLGKSVTNEDAPSGLSPRDSLYDAHLRSQSKLSHILSIEDSLRLSKLRARIHRHPSQPLLQHHRLLHPQLPQRSMPSLHLTNQRPLSAGALTTPSGGIEHSSQQAYQRLLNRRALLAAIRYGS